MRKLFWYKLDTKIMANYLWLVQSKKSNEIDQTLRRETSDFRTCKSKKCKNSQKKAFGYAI